MDVGVGDIVKIDGGIVRVIGLKFNKTNKRSLYVCECVATGKISTVKLSSDKIVPRFTVSTLIQTAHCSSFSMDVQMKNVCYIDRFFQYYLKNKREREHVDNTQKDDKYNIDTIYDKPTPHIVGIRNLTLGERKKYAILLFLVKKHSIDAIHRFPKHLLIIISIYTVSPQLTWKDLVKTKIK
jgi:hypothetical protein